ncbi:IclR family transcriptional regulator [Wenxinia marina]|uniref:Transcriptional regulator, IclR family n=1 Tax=Wenxinia marina DSM 24838 TaxID=1123501 RepID=A0A0D0Q775_9RHOB|nr:IclR family transcriptional regulator [Wenxinia marina]KIQ68317.1 transcriptional regulator, IclR family [Wenxinia marina DSM 24838]GGL79690.1 transcriptional regulator [Wenxinia marina]
MKRDRNDEAGQRRIQSIEVGFKVIRVMEAAESPMPLRDIAAAAGMPPSKAHLYLVSFIREGLARQDPVTGHYGLGSFAIQLGHSALRQLDVVDMSREELTSLQQATGFASYLSLWGNRGPGIVSKVDGHRQGSLAVRLGYVLPLAASATGQVFLAYLPESETGPILREELEGRGRDDPAWKDRYDPIDAGSLEAVTEEVRERGFAMSTNNINANFAAMAAPVFDHTGRILATVTLLGPDKAVTGQRRKATASALLEVTDRLSARLGYARNREAAHAK